MRRVHSPDSAERTSNKATLRVFQILGKFIGRKSSYGVTELSQELGISKNMAFRALATLVEHGYLVRDATGTRYDLGFGVLALANDGIEDFDLRAVCAPYLARIHDITGESIFLSIIVGRNHVTIDRIEAHGRRVSHNPPGLLVPLHASPASRVLLAFLHDEEIADYIRAASPLKRFTATTITEPGKLWEEVARVRREAFARGFGDHYSDATYVAFPVLDSGGRPHAAITVGGPADRLTQDRVDALLPAIMSVMAELNASTRLYPASLSLAFQD